MTGATLIRVIDTETTGFPPDASMVEIAWTDVSVSGGGTVDIGETVSHLLKPRHAISFEAMATHHITPDMVRDAPLLGELPKQPATGSDILAAHNVEFDRHFYDVQRPWICTLKCARRAWPDAPRHSNGVLRYWLGLDAQMEAERTLPAHRAGPDSYVTAHLLEHLLEHHALETLLKWSDEPSLLPRVHFGKHKGEMFSDLPSDYLRWIVSDKCSLGTDVKATARHWLKERS